MVALDQWHQAATGTIATCFFTSYCQMRQISLQTACKIHIRYAMHFFGNAQQLQRHDSVHLSSVSTDYSVSSVFLQHCFFTALYTYGYGVGFSFVFLTCEQ